MNQINLFPHQQEALEKTASLNRVAYYHDMGLGKTFTGSEKANSFPEKILVVCQKSKIKDWTLHFKTYYNYTVFDCTKKRQLEEFCLVLGKCVGVVNYDVLWRRKDFAALGGYTLILDESSEIQNEKAKRTKFILTMQPTNIILLSGTPTSGRYERLWSQLRLLGWGISKDLFYKQYIITEWLDVGGFEVPYVVGYKNVDRLKQKLSQHGAHFLKTEEVLDLPEQTIIPVHTEATKEYKKFMDDEVITINGRQFVGDTSLTKRMYARMMCSYLNEDRLRAFADLMNSTDDRLIVFYNFNDELATIRGLTDRPISIVNGTSKDLTAYENEDNSVTFIQYQAGSMGLNLQKANKIIYFSLPERSDLFEQSKKRIHRIGQENKCFYYIMYCPGTVEESILRALKKRKDYTDELFRKEFKK